MKQTQKEYDIAKLLGGVGVSQKSDSIQRHFDAGWALLKLLESRSDVKEERARPSPAVPRDVNVVPATVPDATVPDATIPNAPALILDYSDSTIDFAEFFSSDGADLSWEVDRAKSHALFNDYLKSIADDVDEDWQWHGCTCFARMLHRPAK